MFLAAAIEDFPEALGGNGAALGSALRMAGA